jgi:hypothetical protein
MLTVKKFKELLEKLPDNMEIVLFDKKHGEAASLLPSSILPEDSLRLVTYWANRGKGEELWELNTEVKDEDDDGEFLFITSKENILIIDVEHTFGLKNDSDVEEAIKRFNES